ncbi:hypothetical protein IAT38_001439 [Cryptococcus sp. DSM 104549]
MPKHQRSLSPPPPTAKRRYPAQHTIRDLFPYEEIFLRILSFLRPSELAAVQGVNRHWARMSLDPQLWKSLYLERYPHPHHSRLIYTNNGTGTGTSTPPAARAQRSLRPIARLPSRAFPPPSPSRSSSVTLALGSAAATPDRIGASSRQRELGGEDDVAVRNDGVDWKLMLRLGTNWSNGNALTQSSIPLPPSPSPSLPAPTPASRLPPAPSALPAPDPPAYTEQHIALFPSFIFTSSPTSPLVQVHPVTSTSSSGTGKPLGIIPPPPGWSSPHRPDNVTAICADQSVVLPDTASTSATGSAKPALPARLAIFYQSGGFAILTIRHAIPGPGITWAREAVHPGQTRPLRQRSHRRTAHAGQTGQGERGDPVVLGAMYWPVLIACTMGFHVSVYDLLPEAETPAEGEGGGSGPRRPKHLETMHSDVSFHPASLSLFPSPSTPTGSHSPSAEGATPTFQAALTYCSPLYPSSWTVAVQEISISLPSLPPSPSPSPTSFPRAANPIIVRRGECYHVGTDPSSPSTLFPSPSARDNAPVWPRPHRPLIGVKGRATGVGSDGRWCVLAGEDNQIQVYSLPTPDTTPEPEPEPTTASHSLPRDKAKGKGKAWKEMERKHPPIVWAQTLLADSAGAVTSLALSSGRCVSGGRDGRVLVWELDEGGEHDEVVGVEAEEGGGGRLGRTVGYVEVKPGGRRSIWRGAAGPRVVSSDSSEDEGDDDDEDAQAEPGYGDLKAGRRTGLPHPQSISSAARSLFLPRPPVSEPNDPGSSSRTGGESSTAGAAAGREGQGEGERPAIRYLTFDEEKIVGLVRGGGEEVLKVWNLG